MKIGNECGADGCIEGVTACPPQKGVCPTLQSYHILQLSATRAPPASHLLRLSEPSSIGSVRPGRHSRTVRRRMALPITLTDDSAMAAAAMIGDSRMPKSGYSMPAATGTPRAL